MSSTAIAAITGLVVALTTFVTTIITLVQVIRGQAKAAVAHEELRSAVVAPRTVEAHGETLVVNPPAESAA